MEKDCPSDPYSCLSFRSDAQASVKQELHLGNRGYTRLTDFHAFISLDQLWINNNKLTSLAGLESNFRLKILYAFQNRIHRLHGALKTFKFLVRAHLSDNKLDDLQGTLDELSKNKYLEVLDLYGNPIAQEDNYRLLVIINIPWLKVLDRLQITDEERVAANELEKKLNSLSHFKFKGPKRRRTEEEEEERARQEATCQRAMGLMAEYCREKRIFLERYFLEVDRQRRGLIDEATFSIILKELDLLRSMDEGDEAALLRKYKTRVPSSLISEAFAKTTPTKYAIDYKTFCEDMLPAGLRVLADTKYVPDAPLDISLCTVDLEKFTEKVERRRKQEDAERLRASVSAAPQASGPVFSTTRRPYKCEEHGLNPWFASQLLKKMKAIHTSSGDTLGKSEVKLLLAHMEVLGCVPEMGVFDCRQQMLGPDNNVTVAALCDALGCEGLVGVMDASDISPEQKRPMVKWRLTSSGESEQLASREFDSAAVALDALLRVGPSDDPQDLNSKTMSHSTSGTRLLARRVKTKTPKAFLTPQDVLRGMGNRADMVVLPNLKGAEAKAREEAAILNKFDFSGTFEALGLSGLDLEFAMQRKKRSLLDQQAVEAALKRKEAESAGKVKPEHEERVSELRKFLKAPMYKKGWSAATGTVTFG